jgi:glycosyltransferase involved in cell wall biosynthesis
MGGVRSVVSTISGLGYAFSGSSVLAAFRKWFTLRLYQLALRHRRSLVIFQNLENEALFLRSGAINKNQSRLIPGSGVDIDLFQFKPESPGEPCVVLASRMLADKGVASFVEAARRLRSQGVFAKFLLVGDIDHGNPASLTRNQLLDWSTSGAVTWLGHSNDMVNILRDCHIVCLPAVFGEGLPKVLLEAACSGRAIVTTDVPGCRDIGVHEENALVVPPGDTDALAAALKLLLDSPELRRRFGAAGRRLVEERFKQSLIIEKTLAVYTELLADA